MFKFKQQGGEEEEFIAFIFWIFVLVWHLCNDLIGANTT